MQVKPQCELVIVKREKINTRSASSIVWADCVIPGKVLIVLLVASTVDKHRFSAPVLPGSNFKTQLSGFQLSHQVTGGGGRYPSKAEVPTLPTHVTSPGRRQAPPSGSQQQVL